MIKEWLKNMGSSKRNLLTSILLLVVMGVFAVLTIFIVVDAINKKYYNDIKVEYEVQEESPNVILTFARSEGSNFSTDNTKVVLNEDKTKFRIDGTVPTIENGVVANLDDLTSSDGREFYFFSTNSSFIDPQEDPENPDFIFSDTDSRYYVSTESDPIWYDVPASSENLTLYSVFLTPNVHNSDFANAPLLNTSPNVIISHDVTEIPYNAFSDLMAYQQSQGQTGVAKIESAVIPNSTKSINSEIDEVTQIIGGAFAACTTLTNIIIPGSVEYVGGEAFIACTGLDTVEYGNGYYLPAENNEHAILIDTNLKAEDVTIHEDCISIQGNTFSKYISIMLGLIVPDEGESEEDYINMNLQKITIPKNVKNIGMGAFMVCMGLENVVFEGNSNLTSIGMYSFMDCSSLKTINLEDTKLEEIGMRAFASMNSMSILIEEITLPSTLKTIDMYAFEGCSSLSKINIQIESIGSYLENLQEFNPDDPTTYPINMQIIIGLGSSSMIPSILLNQNGQDITDIEIPDTTTEIPMYAFTCLTNIKSVNISSSVTSIGEGAFAYCFSLSSITIPDSVTSIGERAFYNCSSLTSITIPDSVMSIGDNAFYNCTGLTSITFEDMTGLINIGTYIFDGCDNVKQLTIQSGEVKNLDFSDLSNLTTVTLGDGVTSIGNFVFHYCSSLTSITIPDSVTSIGDSAFESCSSLENINFGANSQLTSIGGSAFISCSSLTSITIPDSVTSIGSAVFSGCSSLTSITIPSSVTSIGNFAFRDCSNIQELRIDNLISYLNILYGNYNSRPLYDTNQAVSLYVGGELITNLEIPNGVTAIPDYAFIRLNITGVTIPSSVTSIGSAVFSGCSSLTSITIPDSVTSIGSSAFRNCIGLISITFEDMTGLTNIGTYIFDGCDNVKQLTIQSGEVKDLDFSDLSNLTTVTLGDSVTSIGSGAFRDCSSLTSIAIPNSVTSIGNQAFDDCSSLETVNFGENSQLTSIGVSAFYNCRSLTSIAIPNSVTSIGNGAFNVCSSLSSITIPESVTSIGSYAFQSCISLTSITIPENVTSIGDFAFQSCISLISITIPNSVTSIGNSAFRYCDKLTIYCEASSQPSGWDSDWNSSNRPVYWAGEWEMVDGVPVPIE